MLEIAMQSVDQDNKSCKETELLTGEIEGVGVLFTQMQAGKTKSIPGDTDVLRVIFLLDGSISVKGDRECTLDRQGAVVPHPHELTVLTAMKTSQWLEIVWTLCADDSKSIGQSKLPFPLVFNYEKSKRYRDPFKSDKTISRSVIDHHILPKFAMGSVESFGFDRVEPHAHPLIDQFFFSFSENQAELIVEDDHKYFGGYTLIHIPLGSSHGVQVFTGKKMHYLWIDFMVDKKGLAYLDKVHIPTDY